MRLRQINQDKKFPIIIRIKYFPTTYLRKTKSFKRKKLDRREPRIEDLLFDFGGDASGSTAKVTEALGCDSSFSSDMLGIFSYSSFEYLKLFLNETIGVDPVLFCVLSLLITEIII